MAEPDTTPGPPTSWRRHLRFRLSLLLLFVIAVGATIGLEVKARLRQKAEADFLDAVKKDDVERLQWCLGVLPELVEKSYRAGTPLQVAVRGKRLKSIRVLLEAGADVNARGVRSDTPLHLAVKYRDLESMRVLLEAGADAEARDTRGDTPLFLVWNHSRPGTSEPLPPLSALVALLLKWQANPRAKDSEERTPLARAVESKDHKSIRVLLMHGAGPEGPVISGTHVLHIAVKKGDYEMAKLLLEIGKADPNAADHRWTSLQCAVAFGKVNVVPLLVEHGARLGAPRRYPISPLSMAVDRRNLAMVKALLEIGADPTEPRRDGSTLLHQIAYRPGVDDRRRATVVQVARALIDAGADPLAKDKRGNTPLEIARLNSKQARQLMKLLEDAVAKKRARKE